MTYYLGYLLGMIESALNDLRETMHEGYCAAMKEEDDV